MTATTTAPATTTTTGTPATAPTTGAPAGAPTGSGDAFSVTLSGVASVVKDVESLLGSGSGVAGEVASAVVDILSFAQIGSTVGAQNAALSAKHIESVQKVLELITTIKGLVEQAAQGYADADAATAQGFGGDTGTGATSGAQTVAATGPTHTPDPTQTAAATQPDTSGPYHNGMPAYTSPNAHPDALRTDSQGHTHYDMTGHEAPTTRPAGTLDSWITDAKSVLAAHGTDTSSMSDADLRTLIQHESSGDPNALNDWDRNARNGIPSKGLMQTIDSTFDQNAVPGHTDVWNPVDNIVAGVRYGIGQYGSFGNIPGIRSLHQGGAYRGY